MGLGTMMGFGSNKVKTKIRNKYEPYKRSGSMALNRIFNKNLKYEDKQRVLAAIKDHVKGGRSITNKKILEVVKEKYNNYALRERIRKVLVADPKSGLTPDQIERNINTTRYFRNQGDVREVEKSIYGIKRGGNISSLIKPKGGRISSMADTKTRQRFAPPSINANQEGNALATNSSGQLEASVGKFGLGDMDKEKSKVSIGAVLSGKEEKNKEKDISNFNKYKAKNLSGSNSIPFSKAA
jgi:vacuolar-type H+-ATPase subunit E/Vma4